MDTAMSALSADTSIPMPTFPAVPVTADASIPILPPTPAAVSSPITPIPSSTEKEGAAAPLPASQSASAPRISSRARKPSAKVMEMAEAGPSGTSGPEAKEEPKPQPRFLQPDHFSGLNNGAKPASSARTRWEPVYAEENYLSPEDDPLALRGIPVFCPTMEEFQDFEGYINRTAPWGMRSGIAKIIPPKEWTDNLPAMSSRTLSQVHIKSPIQQNMMGTAGVYRSQNIEKNKTRPLSVKEWFEKCQDEKFVGPSPKLVERDSKEAAVARESMMREKKEKWAKKKEDKLRRKEERAAEEAKIEAEADVDMGEEGEKTDSLPGLDAPSSGSSHSSPDPPKTPEEEPLDDWYQSTDFSSAWLPKNTNKEDYTTEACLRLQEKYWKTMGLGEPSWYGADLMQGSLFAKKETPWNVSCLPNLLDRINCVVPGVNEPYLYFGMWRATFAWHVEDMDLFSINYIHFGAPKFWYAIPQAQADHFERFLANEFPLDYRECDQFIRHKSIAISPSRLKDAQTRVNMLVHNQGEFVITYPRGYHAGFNMGFNCAESVNFATDDWVEYGRKAKHCKCVNFSVRIDVDTMLAEAEDLVEQERLDPGLKRAREEAAGEAEEVAAGKTPKKRAKKAKPITIVSAEDIAIDVTTDSPHPDSIAPLMSSTPMTAASGTPGKAKKQPKAVPRKSIPVKEKPVYHCLFCPSLSTIDLCPVYEPNDFVKAQWKGAAGAPLVVHLMCAQSTPECYFHEEEVDGVETIWVMGVNNVVKDRWTALRCKLCPDKVRAASGVKVQCTKGKCPAAFHYSCAKADEHLRTELWQVEEWVPAPIPEDAPPRTAPVMEKVSNVKLELLCATHNPAQKELKEREKAEELRQRILQFEIGSRIKIKSGSGSCEYKLVRIIEDEKAVELETQPGHLIKAAWSRVDLRTAMPLKRVENEYARHHVTSRKAEAPGPSVLAPAAASAPHPPSLQRAQAKASQPLMTANSASAIPYSAQQQPSGSSHMLYPPSLSASSLHLPQGGIGVAPVRIQHPPPQLQSATNLFPYLTAQVPYPPTLISKPPPASNPHAPVGSWPPDNRQYVQPRPPSVPLSNGHGPSMVYAGHPHPGYMPQMYTNGSGAYPGPGYRPPSFPPQHHLQTYPPQYHLPGANPQYPQVHSAGHHPQSYPSAPLQQRYPVEMVNQRRMSGQSQLSYGSPSAPPGMQHLLNPSPLNTSTNSNASSGTSSIPSLPNSRSTSSGGSGAVGKIDLGLERMHRLMGTIGPIDTPAIHIAGTNGKGSVSAILESILRVAGFQTARYNSPHLLEPRDAIRLNGRPVNADAYYKAITHFEQTSAQLSIGATSFEINTVAAYALMAEFRPDIMIIECGMGGARDATNVIPADLVLATVLTPVGLDHTAFLGETVEAITEEKSSIAVRDALFVIAAQRFEAAAATAHSVGKQCGAEVYDAYHSVEITDPQKRGADTQFGSFVRPAPQPAIFQLEGMTGLDGIPIPSLSVEMRVPLPGAHQINNASTAITILNRLRCHLRANTILPRLGDITVEHLRTGLEQTRWAGRCSWLQHRDPTSSLLPILVDGAHNADSAKSLREYIDTCLPDGGRVTYIVSLSDSKGKTPESVLQPLLKEGDRVATVKFSGPVEGMPWVKPVSCGVIREIAEGVVGKDKVWEGVSEAEGEDDQMAGLKGALAWARANGGLTVVCGSLYLVADAYRVLGMEGYQ